MREGRNSVTLKNEEEVYTHTHTYTYGSRRSTHREIEREGEIFVSMIGGHFKNLIITGILKPI